MHKPIEKIVAPRARVVQIAIGGHKNTGLTQGDFTIIALDSYGRIWEKTNAECAWRELPEPGHQVAAVQAAGGDNATS